MPLKQTNQSEPYKVLYTQVYTNNSVNIAWNVWDWLIEWLIDFKGMSTRPRLLYG